MAVVFDSTYEYVSSCSSLQEKVRRLDVIILALMDSALKAAFAEGKKEYWLDDGQIRTKIVRMSVEEMSNSILAMEKMKQMYLNQLNRRQVRLVDSRNFPGRS